ncbi:hypothetical protein [Saccharothrix variisporea]|uniref:hypothetical protein n=1 Tax=Saccharothrix variisporea TaxID=543527 RepID=UPI001FE7A3BE|nr:hypothetical protein [Saccharothrix variisporea]
MPISTLNGALVAAARIAILFQDVYHFAGGVEDNIRLGRAYATEPRSAPQRPPPWTTKQPSTTASNG